MTVIITREHFTNQTSYDIFYIITCLFRKVYSKLFGGVYSGFQMYDNDDKLWLMGAVIQPIPKRITSTLLFRRGLITIIKT